MCNEYTKAENVRIATNKSKHQTKHSPKTKGTTLQCHSVTVSQTGNEAKTLTETTCTYNAPTAYNSKANHSLAATDRVTSSMPIQLPYGSLGRIKTKQPTTKNPEIREYQPITRRMNLLPSPPHHATGQQSVAKKEGGKIAPPPKIPFVSHAKEPRATPKGHHKTQRNSLSVLST